MYVFWILTALHVQQESHEGHPLGLKAVSSFDPFPYFPIDLG